MSFFAEIVAKSSKIDLEGITFDECERPPFAQRWLFKMSRPIPYTRDLEKKYADGELTTEYVIVSWGSHGDTLIAPAFLNEKGYYSIADMLGYWCADYWVDAHEAMAYWVAGKPAGDEE